MRRLAWLVCLGACAAEPPGSAEQPVYGGSTDTGDPNVVFLVYRDVNQPGYVDMCTGTMIGARTVLTAAHCVKDNVDAGKASDGFMYYGNGDPFSDTSMRIPFAGARYHRDFDPNGDMAPLNDAAVVYLTQDAPLAPVQLDDQPLEPLLTAGTQLRLVGWGDILTTGVGTRRQATIPYVSLNAQDVIAGDTQSGSCAGDSGGPLFQTVAGVERQIGIVSYGPRPCNAGGGAFARVDAFLRDFIVPALDNFEGPCKADGTCVTTGCRTPDPDCDHCGFDLANECNPSCAIPDQNCPRGKGAGEICADSFTCESRICLTAVDDARVKYCSAACVPGYTAAMCIDGQTCQNVAGENVCVYTSPTPTTQGAHCTSGVDCRSGLCEPTKKVCVEPCDPTQANACPAPLSCVASTLAPHVCDTPPPDSGGCSAAGGGAPTAPIAVLVGVLAAVSLRRRPRRP